jgi:hypothetical protein
MHSHYCLLNGIWTFFIRFWTRAGLWSDAEPPGAPAP